MGADENVQHASRAIALDESHAAHVGREVVALASAPQRAFTGQRIAQIKHNVVDLREGLQPFLEWLAIYSPNWTPALAEKVGDEMTANEAAGPANHDTSGLIHLVLNPGIVVP